MSKGLACLLPQTCQQASVRTAAQSPTAFFPPIGGWSCPPWPGGHAVAKENLIALAVPAQMPGSSAATSTSIAMTPSSWQPPCALSTVTSMPSSQSSSSKTYAAQLAAARIQARGLRGPPLMTKFAYMTCILTLGGAGRLFFDFFWVSGGL